MRNIRHLLTVFVAIGGMLVAAEAQGQASPSPFTSATRYDAMHRVIGTIAPDPDGAGPLHYAAVRNTYDDAGRLVTVEKGELASWQPESVGPAGWSGFTVLQQIDTTYDGLDRKLTETMSSGGVAYALTQYSYDAVGRLECTAVRLNPAAYGSLPASACTLGTEGTQGPDRITRNVYDAAGQLTQVQKAYGTSLQQAYATYEYTDNGKQKTVIDANGNRATMLYDGFDRLAQWNFPSSTPASGFDGSTPASAVASANAVSASDYEAYTYDDNGNRKSLRKRDGRVISYDYDALNRMIAKGGAAPGVSYGYDLQGHQTSALFTASGQGITSHYDGFGELDASTSTMGGVSRTIAYQYDADGNRTRVTHPDGVYFQLDHDGLDRLNHASWWSPTGGTTSFLGITYDAAGRRQSVGRGSSSTGYGYDGIGRLTSQAQQFAGGTGNLTETLGYNPASQITSETRDSDDYRFTGFVNANRSYGVNGLNQYTSVAGSSYGYDANGNLTSDGSTTYSYDVENRLVSASGAHNVTLSYDPMGRLFQTVSDRGTTQFLYDGDALAAEYDGSGTMLRRYMFAGEDEPILWDEGSQLNCSATRFLSTDHQGSIVALADCGGNRTNINSYDEWGQPGGGNTGRFQYTGQAWIPELGMYHYKARVYSPILGRFLQTDPIGYRDQVNLYAYVGNDPTDGRDPSGERCEFDDSGRAASCIPDEVIEGSGEKAKSRPANPGEFRLVGEAFKKAYNDTLRHGGTVDVSGKIAGISVNFPVHVSQMLEQAKSARLVINVDQTKGGVMNHPDGIINVNSRALMPTGNDLNNIARSFEHEFIHRTPDERLALGDLADQLGRDPFTDHVFPYQHAVDEITPN